MNLKVERYREKKTWQIIKQKDLKSNLRKFPRTEGYALLKSS